MNGTGSVINEIRDGFKDDYDYKNHFKWIAEIDGKSFYFTINPTERK